MQETLHLCIQVTLQHSTWGKPIFARDHGNSLESNPNLTSSLVVVEMCARLISVVVVSYNEIDNMTRLIPILESIFIEEDLCGEIVVVDDNSPDGTAALVREQNNMYGNIRLLVRPEKLGPGSAFADGFKLARGEIVVGMDTDFSHDPSDMPRFIDKINEGFDIVLASRYIKGGHYEVLTAQTLKKSFASRLGNVLIRLVSGVPLHDFTTSYRAIRREVIDNVHVESKGNSFFMEFVVQAYRSGYKITEIPINFRDRVSGKSKLNLGKQSFSLLKDLVKLRSPCRTVMTILYGRH